MKGWAENFSTAAITAPRRLHRAHEGRLHDEHLGRGLRPRLHHGPRLRRDHHGGLDGLVLRPRAALRVVLAATSPAAIPPGDRARSPPSPPEDIFFLYVRPIGIGGIFAAGLLSILKMSPVIVQATRQALGEVARLVRGRGGGGRGRAHRPRRCRCRSSSLGIAATGLAIFLYFRFSVLGRRARRHVPRRSPRPASRCVIAFLFAAVSAWAIAMISITPISGMTLTTLIVTAVALSALGLRGESGMLQVLLIGGVVCTALSMSGSLVTQYKIALLARRDAAADRDREPRRRGASPPLATTAVILLMARVYGFSPSPAHPNPLPAPQPNAMAAVLRGVMGDGGAPWFLYGDRRGVRGGRGDVRRLRARLRARHVPADGAQLAARPRRGRRLAPAALLEGRGRRLRAARGGHAGGLGLHRRRGARRASSRPCCASSRSRPGRRIVPDLTQAARARARGSRPGATGPASPCSWPSAPGSTGIPAAQAP